MDDDLHFTIKREVLLAADAQYNIDYGRLYGRWLPFELQKRWSSWTFATIIGVNLKVCVTVSSLMSIIFENLYARPRRTNVYIWKHTWILVNYILSIL